MRASRPPVSDLRRWIVSCAAFAAAACLLVAGTIVWRQMSPQSSCSANAFCALAGPAYRLHPLRAELLWAAGGLCAVVGLCLLLTTMRGRPMPRIAGPGMTIGH